MNMDKLSHLPTASASTTIAGTTINLTQPFNGPSGVTYRQVYYLRFNLDTQANGICIDSDSSAFGGRFKPYVHSLLSNHSHYLTKPWQTVTEEGATENNLVKVHLTHPWRLLSVKTGDTRGVEVLRLDGDAVSESPTVIGNANYTFSTSFIGQNFALRKVSAFPFAAIVATKELTADVEEMEVSIGLGVDVKFHMESMSGGTSSSQNKQHQSVQETAQMASLHGIHHIKIKSVPTGPRIILGDATTEPINADSKLLNAWQQPGEVLESSFSIFSQEKEKKQFIAEIQKRLDDYFKLVNSEAETLSNDIYVPLVIESDMPARFVLDNIDLPYSLLKSRFSTIGDKTHLDFHGRNLTCKRLALALPETSAILKAGFTLKNRFRSAIEFNSGHTQLLGALPQQHGVKVNQQARIASKITVAKAVTVDMIALAILPWHIEVGLNVKLVADQNNAPDGMVLGEVVIDTLSDTDKHWVNAFWGQTIVLDEGDYWIELSSTKDDFLWLGQTASGCVHVVNKASKTVLNKITDTELLYCLGLSALALDAESAFKVSVGDINITPTSDDNETWHYDIQSALTALLPSLATNHIPLSICSSNAGSVTLYPPLVEYAI